MLESPYSLEDICVDVIYEQIAELYDNSKRADIHETTCEITNALVSCNAYLPSSVSEHILERLGTESKLNDRILRLFSSEVTKLQKIKVLEAAEISSAGLSVLRDHKISELEVRYLSKLDVNELIGCLGEWSLQNLKLLSVSHCTFSNSNKICVMVALSKLKNLSSLDVSNTEFNFRGLDIVTHDMPLLESLNISQTLIMDITPLTRCRERLKVLKMYNLSTSISDHFLTVLYQLNNLRFLDISCDRGDIFLVVSSGLRLIDFLNCTACLPQIVSLDLSGNCGIYADSLRKFLESHRTLKFLGLMLTEACTFDMFVRESNEFFNPDLEVSGHSTSSQLIESLERYMTRLCYIKKSLNHLYTETQDLEEVRLDILKLVLEAMQTYKSVTEIQASASACLYNLIKGKLGLQIHPHWLKKVVDLILVAMHNFPRCLSIQKNALLILCSDRMLQDVTFDGYFCAQLVMESLVFFDNVFMNRMAVAICSVLAGKISVTETSLLGTRPSYMKRLLDIVKAKTKDETADMILKFTLSILWNLTDESPFTCQFLMSLDGMEVLLDVLNTFPGQGCIEKKVLGLMNNVAEVFNLRSYLKKDGFIPLLRSLLHSPEVDVSYFAAGIVAHLGSDTEIFWSCSPIPKQEMLQELGNVVRGWKEPEAEMVVYRSFASFFRLLQYCNEPEVHLWAVWAIHHVCFHNSKRYVPMFIEENGVAMIENLLQDPSLDSLVGEYCLRILVSCNQTANVI